MSGRGVSKDSNQQRSRALVSVSRSRLLVVDMQERLLPVISGGQAAVATGLYLIRCAAQLGVPVCASEQYPKGLGATVPELAAEIPSTETFEKLRFSAADGYEELWAADAKRKQVVIVGIEAHICVLQTSFDLKAGGYDVCVVADGVASRSGADRDVALQRLLAGGVSVVTAESVAFEWCEVAGTDQFRAVSRLTQERDFDRSK